MPLSAALSCPLAELAPVSSPIRQAGLLFGHSVGEEAASPASPVLPPGPGHRPWCLAVPVPVVSRASAQTQSLRATCSSVVIHSQVSLSQPVSSTEVQRLLRRHIFVRGSHSQPGLRLCVCALTTLSLIHFSKI